MTGTGGDVLFVEATSMEGKDGLVLTGQLGDVMKESARIALSLRPRPRRRAGHRPSDAFDDREFHVHVPAGAIPKDGPSAGVTMTTALASLLSGRPVKHTVGHDRRGHAAGPGAADRRAQAEGARRARGRADRRDPPRAQPRRPRRRARGRARADDVPPGDDASTRCSSWLSSRPAPRRSLSDASHRRPVPPPPGAPGGGAALIALSAGLGIISPFLLRDVLDVAIPENNDGLLALLVRG